MFVLLCRCLVLRGNLVSGRVMRLPSRYGYEGEVQFLVSITN